MSRPSGCTHAGKVRDVVEVVAAPGNRRTQVTRRDIPGVDAIGVLQQRLVERLDGGRIRVVDRQVAVGVRADEAAQPGAAGYQAREVVAGAEPVPLVQLFLGGLSNHALFVPESRTNSLSS